MNKDYIPLEPSIITITELFKALGDQTRVRILWTLMDGEMCVGELADYIAMTKSAVSHQLRALRMVNLVKIRRDGKRVYYSLKSTNIERFLECVNEFADSRMRTVNKECQAKNSSCY